MDNKSVKFLIIGAGTAGLSAYSEVKKVTDDFLMINGGSYGTTCARVGCMPSKALIQLANDCYRRKYLDEEELVEPSECKINYERVWKRVRDLRDYFVEGVMEIIDEIGEKNIEGYAKFLEPNVVQVNDLKINADKIIIATGSSPIVPKDWDKYEDFILTTDDIFDTDKRFQRLAVIGGGAIGLEMGQAFSRFGIEVVLFEAAGVLGGLTDPAVNEKAVNIFQSEFDLKLKQEAHPSLKNHKLHVNKSDKNFDAMLVSIGRKPNVDKLDLENLGVSLDDNGMPSFDMNTMQLEGLPIYIAGDVNGYRPVLHEAADEGRIAGYNAANNSEECFERRVPLRIAFTEPNIAVVGKGYSELDAGSFVIGEYDFKEQARARMMGKAEGIIRIYGDPENGKILGSEMIIPDGEYIGHLLAWAVNSKLTAYDLLKLPFYHPTLMEGLRSALRNLVSKTSVSRSKFEMAVCDTFPVERFG